MSKNIVIKDLCLLPKAFSLSKTLKFEKEKENKPQKFGPYAKSDPCEIVKFCDGWNWKYNLWENSIPLA